MPLLQFSDVLRTWERFPRVEMVNIPVRCSAFSSRCTLFARLSEAVEIFQYRFSPCVVLHFLRCPMSLGHTKPSFLAELHLSSILLLSILEWSDLTRPFPGSSFPGLFVEFSACFVLFVCRFSVSASIASTAFTLGLHYSTTRPAHFAARFCMSSLRKRTMGCLKRLMGRLRPAWIRSRATPRPLQIVC